MTGPFAAGIVLASAMMYLRVIILIAVLSPSTLPQFLIIVAPAAAVTAFLSIVAWHRAPRGEEAETDMPGNPIELLPAFGFVAIVAVAALVTRWAQARYGEAGIATSLFITGSFDVDAAVVTLSGLPITAIDRSVAAIALAGTIVANMLLKIFVIFAYARQKGRLAALGLAASTLVLLLTIGGRLLTG
jgi:uncharacterized membrane protein (DUF4010 family)